MSASIIIDAIIGGVLVGGIYGVVAIGLTLIFGILNIINFAHGEFLMLGMYISFFACTLLGMDPYLSLIIVIPITFALGVLCQKYLIKPVMSSPQDIQILLTFGLVLVLQNMALLLWKGDWRSLSDPLVFKIINCWGISIRLTMVIAFIASLVLVFLLFIFLKKTDYGKAIRACANDHDGALFVGLNLNKIYCLTFGIGAALAAIAGALFLPFFSASPTVGLLFTFQAFIIIVLGGLGSVPGALIGGIIIGITESLGALFLSGSLKSVATFVIFIVIICIRPSGIFGQKERV